MGLREQAVNAHKKLEEMNKTAKEKHKEYILYSLKTRVKSVLDVDPEILKWLDNEKFFGPVCLVDNLVLTRHPIVESNLALLKPNIDIYITTGEILTLGDLGKLLSINNNDYKTVYDEIKEGLKALER